MNQEIKYTELPFDATGYFKFKLQDTDSPVFHAWKSVYNLPYVMVCWSELNNIVAVDYKVENALEFLNTGKWTVV